MSLMRNMLSCSILICAMAGAAGVYVNEDSNNFVYSFPAEKMTREGLEEHAEFYASGKMVKKIFWNPNCQTASYNSKVIDPIWAKAELKEDGFFYYKGKKQEGTFDIWPRNLLRIEKAGLDCYTVWLAKTRACGCEAWISDRMNDAHSLEDFDSLMHDRFWLEHPEFRLGTHAAFDFAHPEVRANKLALIQELLDRYDMDGLELDWMRFPYHLKNGFEGREHLTDVMRGARKLVNAAAERRGHPIRLAVRIPSRPSLANAIGIDFLTWRKENLMDFVSVGNFWPNTDSDMPIEEWHRLLGADMEVNASFELLLQGYPGGRLLEGETLETFAGFASQYLYRGANNIYLFNHMRGATGMGMGPEQLAEFRRILDEGADPAKVYAMPRRHLLSYGTAQIVTESVLPLTPSAEWNEFKLNIGGGTAGRKAFAVFGFWGDTPVALNVKVNGNACELQAEPYAKPCGAEASALASFKLPDGTLKDGYNTIAFQLAEGEARQIIWFEIWIP